MANLQTKVPEMKGKVAMHMFDLAVRFKDFGF